MRMRDAHQVLVAEMESAGLISPRGTVWYQRPPHGSNLINRPCRPLSEQSLERRQVRLGFLCWILLLGGILGCGPLGPFRGGELNGESISSSPEDWSFTEAHRTVQLEVRLDDPYSVNVWCVTTGGKLYVGAGQGESSVWARALLEDGSARVRIGTALFDVSSVRVTSVAEIEAFLDALESKYEVSDANLSDFQASSRKPATAILFRFDP